MKDMIHVRVKLFGPAADMIGSQTLEYNLTPPATLATLLELLYGKYPRLAGGAAFLRFAVNGEYADAEVPKPLVDGDEIGVIPPVSGGGDELVELTRERIKLARLVAYVRHRSCGGLVTFEGVVRDETSREDTLEALEYSAYESMALTHMQRLRQEAMRRFAIHEAAIVHRVGRLGIGETSVAIAVSAAHRADAFEACRWIIDTLKRDVPIWKKEVWQRGEAKWAVSR